MPKTTLAGLFTLIKRKIVKFCIFTSGFLRFRKTCFFPNLGSFVKLRNSRNSSLIFAKHKNRFVASFAKFSRNEISSQTLLVGADVHISQVYLVSVVVSRRCTHMQLHRVDVALPGWCSNTSHYRCRVPHRCRCTSGKQMQVRVAAVYTSKVYCTSCRRTGGFILFISSSQLNCISSRNFVSFRFVARMTISRNTEFRCICRLHHEITEFVSPLFRGISAKRSSTGNTILIFMSGWPTYCTYKIHADLLYLFTGRF